MAKGSFKKNTVWLVLTEVYSMIISIVVGPLTARVLGPTEYGLITYGESIVSIFLNISQLGLNQIIVSELVANPKRKDTTLGTILVLRLFASIASFFLIIATVSILRPGNTTVLIVTLLQSSMLLVQALDVFNYWFQAELLSKYTARISMLAMTVASAYKVYLAIFNQNVYLFSLATALRNGLLVILVAIVFFKFNPSCKPRLDKELAKYLLSRSYNFIIAALGSIIYSQIDKIMVGNMVDDAALGQYSVAYNLMNIWNTIPEAFISSATPLIIAAKSNKSTLYKNKLQLTYLGIFIICTIGLVGTVIFGNFGVHLLYGDAYDQSPLLLNILMIASIMAHLGMVREAWILAEKYEKYSKYFTLIGSCTDIVLNYFFIQWWGVTGATVSTVISEAVVFFVTPYLFKETRCSNRLFFGCFSTMPQLLGIARGNIQIALHKIGMKSSDK